MLANRLNSVKGGLQWAVPRRELSCLGESFDLTGVVLGLWSEDADEHGMEFTLTSTAAQFDRRLNGKLTESIHLSGPVPKLGQTRMFYGMDAASTAVCLVGLGNECVGYNDDECLDEFKEAIRTGAGAGAKALQEVNMRNILCDDMGHAESSAEGAAMGVWVFQELRSPNKHCLIPRLELYESCDFTGWQIGLQKAAAQNLCRQLCETPSNLLTPILFAQCAVEILCKAGINVEVKIREWAKLMDMHAFLAASRGSCEPPIFLEMSYYGCDPETSPIVLVGKGVTFDSGGLCLKDTDELKHMRGDMAGAACIVSAMRAVSALQLPINVRGLVPLCENLPGTCAMKVGDIIRARNGKTILVEDTDFDGRLCLADALSYAASFNPKFILDIGTLCKESEAAFGGAATVAFSNNDELYEQLRIASIHTGDRVWRLPLWDHFTEKVTAHPSCDVRDKYRSTGASCSCAAFLKEFIPNIDWIHLDTYGVNRSDGRTYSYLRRGMSGRPSRTVIEFLAQLACTSSSAESVFSAGG